MKIKYLKMDDVIKVNRRIVQSDISKIKEQLKNPSLSVKEREYLKRLLKFKENAVKKVVWDPADKKMIDRLMKEGEDWYKRKDKHFQLDHGVLTD